MAVKKATLRTIAAQLNIAPSTVLRALSGKPNVRPDLRKKIVSCAAANGYSLPNHRTGNAAIITPTNGIYNYLSLLLEHLSQELNREGFHAFILSEQDAGALNDYLFDGVISTTWISGIEKNFAKLHSLPFVSLNGTSNLRDNIFTVGSDDFSGITAGLQYLYDAGYRRIAFIASNPDGNKSTMERVAAYQQFFARRNLPGKAEDFYICNAKVPFSQIGQKVMELKADAIFHTSEGNAIQLYSQLRELKLRIPEDISVLGLEHPAISPYMDPPLTTLQQDFEGLARESVSMLKKLISGEEVHSDIRLPYTLIERGSVRKKDL